MKSKRAILAVFIIAGIFNISYGQAKADKIDKLISTYAEYGKFNGSVLVAEKGKVIYQKGLGLADMEWNVPNRPATKFRLGSITKQFTAMLIMQLVEQGKLKLDIPISTYLPDYPKKSGDIITIHHLLTHSSGIPNITSFRGFMKDISRNSYSPQQLVHLFADSALQFKPGERNSYSNSGYMLLGYIIEKITGKSYEQVLQENIFTPLNMKNSGYDLSRPLLKNRARGYEKNGRLYINANFIDMSVPYAAGALYSTVEDLYLWDQALYGNQLLRKENMDLLFIKHIPAGGGHYGYGWNIYKMPLGNTAERIDVIGHGGGIDGFNTQLIRMPSDKSFIVLLNNTGQAPLNEMTEAIAAILHNKPYDLPKRSVAFALGDRIEKDGVPAALEYYKSIKDATGYYLAEGEMNGTGYQFLQSGKVKEAAAIFKLNTQAFPKSSNVYDSYGEALMALGNKTAALENYKRSVQLNPGNEGGIKILKDNGIKTDDLIKKVSIEYLKLLEGEYISVDNKERKIKFELVDSILYGNDRGYRYKVLPVGEEGEFVNADDGASLVFDTKDEHAITMVLFGRSKFRKVQKDNSKSENKEAITSEGPKSISRNIIQDRKGNIWIASWEGVFRYDGKSFINITSNVSAARFFSVLEDSKGNLWFGSIGSGVFYYDGKSFQNFTIKDGLLNNDVGSIYEDKKGNIWFGVFGGASRYDGRTFQNYIIDGDAMNEDRTGKTFPERPPYEVNSIIEDKSGSFWFATRGNTFVYDGKTFTVFTHENKPFKNVRSIIEDKKGNIWLGGADGLWCYGGSTFTNFTQKFVGYIIEDKKGNIWTSSERDNIRSWALSRYEEKSLFNKKPTITEIKAEEGMFFGILEANDGSIWFGKLGGVYRYDGNTITSFNDKKGQQ